jgi:hypothetical protein
VRIETEEIRRHYAALSDEALLDVNREDLTDAARECYDAEIAERQLGEAPMDVDFGAPVEDDGEVADDWMETAACACAFAAHPGSPSANDAGHAREVLQAAGIPAQVSLEQVDETHQEYRVMVPGALNLKAASVLDLQIFNPEVEAEWRNHFEALSDEDLADLSADVLCAGLMDRVRRLKRAFEDEVAARRLG